MDHTLDELGDKLAPRHLMEEAVDYFWTREHDAAGKAKQSAIKMGRKVVDEVRDHPLPSLLIGAGIVWLLSQQRDKSQQRDTSRIEERENAGPGLKEKAGEALDTAKERAREGVEAVKERASDIADSAKEKFGTAKERIGSAVESAKAKSSDVKERTKDAYHRTAETVRQTSDEHPLAVGLACLAAGVLAGVAAPRTRVEDRTIGAASDRVVEAGKERVEDIAEKGKEVVGQAIEAGREEARQEDLSPEGLSGESELKTTGEYKIPGGGI